MNGNGERIITSNPKNYKLLVDPLLTGKKEPKVYRYEGVVAGDSSSSIVVRDPRNRITALSKRSDSLDLPVPR